MSRETRRDELIRRYRASIENSALCDGLAAARNQGPEGKEIKIGDTAPQRCRPPIHCPCGSLTTESRKGSRQGGCPPGHWAYRCPLLGFDLPAENRHRDAQCQ